MPSIRLAIAGTGYRALRFARVAQLLPEHFTLTGMLSRTAERAQALTAQEGIAAFSDLDALLQTKPEYVVCCVSAKGMAEMTARLLEAGVPTLCETPFAQDLDGLLALYETQKRTGTPLALAEQYFLFPSHQARCALVRDGLLGDVSSCQLSVAHHYHAVSLLRFYLSTDDATACIDARVLKTPLVNAGDRSGYIAGGGMGEEERMLAQFTYADGKLGLYDFAPAQYRSAIRSSHLRILGSRGEWFDDTARYVRADGRPAVSTLHHEHDLITGTLRAIDFEGTRVYENPFRTDVPMIQDDIAIAEVLRRMGDVVRAGIPFYPLAHAFRDGYLSHLMHCSARQGAPVHAQPMPWDRDM